MTIQTMVGENLTHTPYGPALGEVTDVLGRSRVSHPAPPADTLFSDSLPTLLRALAVLTDFGGGDCGEEDPDSNRVRAALDALRDVLGVAATRITADTVYFYGPSPAGLPTCNCGHGADSHATIPSKTYRDCMDFVPGPNGPVWCGCSGYHACR